MKPYFAKGKTVATNRDDLKPLLNTSNATLSFIFQNDEQTADPKKWILHLEIPFEKAPEKLLVYRSEYPHTTYFSANNIKVIEGYLKLLIETVSGGGPSQKQKTK